MQKIFVLGSCVSRDTLTYARDDSFQLTGYLTRTSFASALEGRTVPDNYSDKLASPFQARCVASDLAKSLPEILETSEFDKLVLDFIDERFDLFEFEDGAICTISSPLVAGGFEPAKTKGRVIKSGSKEHLERWVDGWNRLCAQLRTMNRLDAVRVNRVFWSKVADDGEGFGARYSNEQIDAANDVLAVLYDLASKTLKEDQFISFDAKNCIGATKHKWGREPFHYIDDYYLHGLKGLELTSTKVVPVSNHALQLGGAYDDMTASELDGEQVASSTAKDSVTVDPALAQAHFADKRSLERWPSVKHWWSSVDAFLDAPVIGSGIHSIYLSKSVLDVYIEIVPGTDALVYLHENCPRSRSFKLPVFSGSNVSYDVKCTKIVPSDPLLLLDENIELSWHAGSANLPLQDIYKAIFSRVFAFAKAEHVTFWGGSGGGFASLYYSYFFPQSTALVWNPQTNIAKYKDEAIKRYLTVGFGIDIPEVEDAARILGEHVTFDVSDLYGKGHKNKVVFLQNNQDWHAQVHLAPLLSALGLSDKVNLPQELFTEIDTDSPQNSFEFTGLLSDNFYLHVGRISQGHNPPPKWEIYCVLNTVMSLRGDIRKFDFTALKTEQHRKGRTPEWLLQKVLTRKIAAFRTDWPQWHEAPNIEEDQIDCIKFLDGTVIKPDEQGRYDWENACADINPWMLFSLTHVGRLFSRFEESSDPATLAAALKILSDFMFFVEREENYAAMARNRGWSSFDHSTSIRANVYCKALQVLGNSDDHRELKQKIVGHLWDSADFFCDPKNIYASNHGIMCCVTLAQIANQFANAGYLAERFLQASAESMLRLVRKSLDSDGFSDENTIGYHLFVLQLITDYVEYFKANDLKAMQLDELERAIRKARQALAFCVRQDGSVPTIGDSPVYRTKVDSVNHSKWFKESGLLIIKDDHLYLSLVCGARSDNHKQCDDSSITLTYRGEDLLIDGGSYCYDRRNPHRAYLESFRGHTSFYAEHYGTHGARNYVRGLIKSAKITSFSETYDGSQVTAEYVAEIGGYSTRCVRRIWKLPNDEFIVVDEGLAEAGPQSQIFTQSFLLAPALKLVQEDDACWAFEGERYGVALTHYSLSEVGVRMGEMDPRPAGWCSMDWGKVLPTHQLFFSQRAQAARFVTYLKVFEKGKRAEAIRGWSSKGKAVW
jgi:hypothetical protein